MKHRWMKAAAAGTTAAVIAAGLLAGVASARPGEQAPSPTPTATPRAGQNNADREQRAQEFINRLAQNLGVSPDRLRDALKQTGLQEVDAALAAGRITAEQAQRAKDAINSGNLPHIGGFPGGGHRGGPGGGRGGDFGGVIRNHTDGVAQFLGITEEKLREELRSGKSLAEIAQANGKTAAQLKTFILTNAKTKLDQAVKDGKITQQMADRMYQELEQRVDDMITRTKGPRTGRN